MVEAGGGRHQQLPVDDFVAIAVVGKLADHFGGPVGWGGHAHSIGSSALGGQESDMPEHDAQAPGCRYRFDVGGVKRVRREISFLGHASFYRTGPSCRSNQSSVSRIKTSRGT